MHLDEFHQEPAGELLRYSLPLADEAGEQTYELLILGSEQQVRDSFGESDFDVTIRPGVTEEEWASDLSRQLSLADEVVPREAFDDPNTWFKQPHRDPTPKDSVLMALRRERPGGTGFSVTVTSVRLSLGSFVTFSGPRMTWFTAQTRPISGDPDLFLTVSGGLGTTGLMASTLPDGLWDTVWAQNFPPQIAVPFVPFLTVRGFTATVALLLAVGWVP